MGRVLGPLTIRWLPKVLRLPKLSGRVLAVMAFTIFLPRRGIGVTAAGLPQLCVTRAGVILPVIRTQELAATVHILLGV